VSLEDVIGRIRSGEDSHVQVYYADDDGLAETAAKYRSGHLAERDDDEVQAAIERIRGGASSSRMTVFEPRGDR